MTPAEKLGYFVGQRFEVIEEGNFIKGSVVELTYDDGSDYPQFNLIEGDMKYHMIQDSSRRAYASLDNIKPIPRTLKPLSELPEKWYVKVTPTQSEELQLALFDQGVTWLSGSSLVNHLENSFLIFNHCGNNSLTRANFIKSIKSNHHLLNYSDLWNYETKEIAQDNEIKPKYELVDGHLPSMKTASEMGFKEGDEFEVVVADHFDKGDILILTGNNNTICPYFLRESDSNVHLCYLSSLKPHTSQTVDESRIPMLKTTGSKDYLLKSISEDSSMHLENVQDLSALSVSDLKDKINMINSSPNRGLIKTSGTSSEITQRCRDLGYNLFNIADLEYCYKSPSELVTTLPMNDWNKYDSMYQSLINTLKEGANKSDSVMSWLLYGFTTPSAIQTEVSVFTDTDKCRFDAIIDTGEGLLPVDIKSTSDASLESFGKSAARYHYDLQAAHYTETGKDAGMNILPFVFIAIESEDPYGVTITIADDNVIESGKLKRNYAKKQLKEYKESGTICAYEPVTTTLTLPNWNNFGEWATEE